MKCVPVKNGFLCFSPPAFRCPHCRKRYADENEKYMKRADARGYTTIRCQCGERFGMAHDMTGKVHAFKLAAKDTDHT